jgi:hypothetical protein
MRRVCLPFAELWLEVNMKLSEAARDLEKNDYLVPGRLIGCLLISFPSVLSSITRSRTMLCSCWSGESPRPPYSSSSKAIWLSLK